MPKNHFKHLKKVADFPYVRGWGRGGQLTYGKFHIFFALTFGKLPSAIGEVLHNFKYPKIVPEVCQTKSPKFRENPFWKNLEDIGILGTEILNINDLLE